ncbi:hypothetical protein ACFQPA_06460 [Halomarina halobia]|uniref:Uncharacterized protein n=1 Tax=Halomarina halobia TaxID=3033386 RepID=A0ABD6A7W5_9EURY|nr:hypothetical protein [Halomarina sp. PSR21]
MPDERSSPSAGWREVYRAMDAPEPTDEDRRDCPDCGDDSPRVRGDTYWCPKHGTWRPRGGEAAG